MGGDAKDDLNLPSGTEDLDKLSKQVKDMFDEGKGIRIVTMTAIGQEQLCGVSEDKYASELSKRNSRSPRRDQKPNPPGEVSARLAAFVRTTKVVRTAPGCFDGGRLLSI